MSLFGWIRRRQSFEPEPERVFLTRAAKWRAFRELVASRRGEGNVVLVVAHFPATLREAQAQLEAAAIPGEIFDRPLRSGDVSRQLALHVAVALVPSPALVADESPADVLDRSAAVSLIVPELHPLRSREEPVEAFARAVPHPTRLCVLVSLDDPLLQRVCTPQVREILRSLGMQEDEELQSGLIARQIRRLQSKLEDQVESDQPAESVEEWLQRNLPATT